MAERRLRFSISNLLLATTIIALSIALWRTHSRLVVVESEVIRRRAEMGHVYVTDPKKVHAIAVPNALEGTSRWRLYLPPGKNYRIECVSGTIPPQATGQSLKDWLEAASNSASSTTSMSTNTLGEEFTFDIRIVQKGQEWFLDFSPFGMSSLFVSSDWIADPRARYVWGNVPGDDQRVFEPGEPILLKCVQQGAFQPLAGGGFSIGPPKRAVDTILLWIEESQ